MNDSPFPPGSSVAAYLRDSGGEEQEQSIAQQEAEVRAYCQSHHLQLSQIFRDEARSGASLVGRDGFWQMIHHFHNGAHERGVIIWRSNRFGRNINDAQFYKSDLRRRGYLVHSLKDNIPDGSAGQLIEFALDWKDQVFIEQLSEDVKRGLRQLVQVYGCVPGTPPRGFVRVPVNIGKRRDGSDHIAHRWAPDETLAPLVRRAFELRASGATLAHIRDATGLYKSINCYAGFFRNRLYIGELHFADIIITDYCEPIIERALWDDVQRLTHTRKLPERHEHHPRRVASPFVLSGVLFCQECGSVMSGYSVGRFDYYVCARRKRTGECRARRIPKAPIEAAIIAQLKERLLSLDALLAIQTEIQTTWDQIAEQSDASARDLDKQLAAVRKRIVNTAGAISEHGHSPALLKQLTELEARENDLRAQLDKLASVTRPQTYTRPQLADLASAVSASLDDETQTRATILGIVARVVARRTDDQITAVMYCNQVIGHVPPRGAEVMTLLYPLEIPVRRRKAPERAKVR